MRTARGVLWSLLVVAVFAGAAFAQSQLGQISGSVTDTTGAVVGGAKVVVTNIATQTRDQAQTNNEGVFAVGNIPVGEYEIAIEKDGFRRATRRVKVEVAQRVSLPFVLEVGAVSDTVEVRGDVVAVNTVSGEVSREITSNELANMPLLTRNPYALVQLAPGAVDTTAATGDEQGIGISVAGQRNRSINFLLDGSENNETFSTGPSTIVPVDAIQEFKVQTNSMTAEFGRNAVQANVVTKSGTNSLHGSAYEFYRGAALSSQPVEEKVNELPKSNYVRNVFGGSLGGPVIKNRTFFFGAMEGVRVRSTGRNFYYVPTQQFFNASSANMQAYLQAGGGLPAPLLNEVITAGQLAAEEGVSGFTTAAGAPIAANTPLWQRTFVNVPIDAGGGTAQDTWAVSGRMDHRFTDNTNLTGRYAWYRQIFPVGASSDSPYSLFNTGQSFRSQNGTLALTHTFGPTLFNETRVAYSRTEPQAPLGEGSVNVQCLQYGLSGSFGTGDQMVFPGYLPAFCSGFAIPSGGPQNTYSIYTSFTKTAGRHLVKWGWYGRHLRDNHTFGAFANANSITSLTQNLLNGQVDSQFALGIDPRGKVPGQTYNIATDGPLQSPSFTRHYRYNETAVYLEDQIKLTPRVTLTAGLRWEYLGVLHSPDGEKHLDANLFLGSSSNVFERIRDARFARTDQLFNRDWNNLAPRLGLAWDITGDSRTVFRAGYGVFYDANFGNALFNVIQNPPNYAVVIIPGDGATPLGPVRPNQFDSLNALLGGTGTFSISSSARMLNPEMVTAYSQQWNATVEHDILGKGIFASLAYVGAKGDKLYSLNNLNQRGSCIMLGAAHCAGDPRARLNQTGLTGMNRRGNEAWSRYHSMQLELKTREITSIGLQLASNYTWAHNIDNGTSFFNDSAFETSGNFGFRDPYNPSADKGNAGNDIRHRLALNYTWNVPGLRNLTGVPGAILGGWAVTGIFTTQSGAPFTVWEDNFAVYNDVCSASGANGCYPIVVGPLPSRQSGNQFVGSNRSVLYDFENSLVSLADFCGASAGAPSAQVRACSQQIYYNQGGGGLFLSRNTFRLPGYWNYDMALMKDFKLPREGTKLQVRAEFFNLFNHSNLFGDPNTNLLSSGQVLARRGVPPGKELYGTVPERRNIQLALRFQF